MHALKKENNNNINGTGKTKLSSMSVMGIFSLKTVNDPTESITHFHQLLMNEV